MYYTRGLGMDAPIPGPKPITNIKLERLCDADHPHTGYLYAVMLQKDGKLFSYENWTEVRDTRPNFASQENAGYITVYGKPYAATEYPAWNEPYVVTDYCEHCGERSDQSDQNHSTESRVKCVCGQYTTIGTAKPVRVYSIHMDRSYRFGFHLFPDYRAAVRGKKDMLSIGGELTVVKVWYRNVKTSGFWNGHLMFVSDKICINRVY